MTDKKRRKPRRILFIMTGTALAAAVALFVVIGAKGAGAGQQWKRVTLTESTDQKSVEASGNIEAARSSDLSFASIGLVAAVYVSEGQRVAQGQALASLDDAAERYRYEDARLKLEQYRLTGNARQASLAELELAMRKLELDRARIDAPFSGFVASVKAEPGEYVSSGKVVLSLVDRSSLVATLQIDEVDVPQIRVGQKVEFDFDALPGRLQAGTVSRVSPVGAITSEGLAVFDVTATIPNPPDDLLPGYSFTARVFVSDPTTRLVVPKAALAALPAALPADAPAEAAAQGAAPAEPARAGAPSGAPSGAPAGAQGAGGRTGAPARGAPGGRPGGIPVELAAYTPGPDGQPVLTRFLGFMLADGSAGVVSGLSAGDVVLVPIADAAKKDAKGGVSLGIPGLSPPPGGRR